MGKCQKSGCYTKTHTDYEKSAAEKLFDPILEEKANHCYRNARHKNLAYIIEIIVTPECEETHT